MYQYDEFDERFVRERTEQFRGQVARRLSGALSEEEFRPLRLKNGLYLQLHAYMLRVAVPYGTLSSKQLRQFAHIADTYDKGYGHFTTRQNIQYNWLKLAEVPDLLADLADVHMHAIQTSGNCIRNITADHFAGVAADEIADPRPVAELMRQWSSGHPEFLWLPRKFKIAVTGSAQDRAVIRAHDIGIQLVGSVAQPAYDIWVGGGLGRTPMEGKLIKHALPQEELLDYLQAILRVYNAEGRRDNKYKARIKILVHEIGQEAFTARVEAEYAAILADAAYTPLNVAQEMARIIAASPHPQLETLPHESEALAQAKRSSAAFARFMQHNAHAHKQPGYVALSVSLKPIGGIPGDMSSAQMRGFADIAERYSHAELRVTHAQNLILPYVRQEQAYAVWQALDALELATPNIGLITDIISCPGLDYCTLATARSIPIAQAISNRFASAEAQEAIGKLGIKISGCINACGHHHVGHIGILGLEKGGKESYQITLGGDPSENFALGARLGPGLNAEDVPEAIARIVDIYQAHKQGQEAFIETWRRIGSDPFKPALTLEAVA
jgi:sulfite reductase (NADPH) hemoprotein beta-component